MLDLLAGTAESLRIEVPGTSGAGAEFRLRSGGVSLWYQAKRQRDGGTWTIAAMGSEGFLTAWLPKLQSGDRCIFVSGTSADELRELADRARDALSWDEFRSEFIVAEQQNQRFQRLVALWGGLPEEDAFGLLKLVEVRTTDEQTLAELVTLRIMTLVDGNADTVCDVLGQFADEQIHRELHAPDVWRRLRKRGFSPSAQASLAAARPPAETLLPRETCPAGEDRARHRLAQLPPVLGSRLAAALRDDPEATWRLITALTSVEAHPRDVAADWQNGAPQWLVDGSTQVQIAAAQLVMVYGAPKLAAQLLLIAAEKGAVRRHLWLALAAMLFDDLDDSRMRDTTLGKFGSCRRSGEPYARAVGALFEDDRDEATRQLRSWSPHDDYEAALRWGLLLRLAAPQDGRYDAKAAEAALVVTGEALRDRWNGRQAQSRAWLLIARMRLGSSPSLFQDLREARELALKVRDERRQWRGDSATPAGLACEAAVLSLDLRAAIDIGTVGHDGATTEEAASPGVREHVALAASQLGDLTLARECAQHLTDRFVRSHLEALIAEEAGEDPRPSWRKALSAAGDSDERLIQALRGLARTGVDELPGLDELALRYPLQAEEIRAIAELAGGRPAAAIARLRARRTDSLSVALHLALTYQAANDTDSYVTTMIEAAEIFHNPSLRFSAAQAMSKAGRTAEARQELDHLLSTTDDAWTGRTDAMRMAANLALTEGETGRGIELSQTVLQLRPDDEATRWRLVEALAQREAWPDAWETLTGAPKPLEPNTLTEGQLWLTLHRRFGSAPSTFEGGLRLLRRFSESEQFSAFVLITLMMPDVSDKPLPPAVLADFHQQLDDFAQRWPDTRLLQRIQADDPGELYERLRQLATPPPEAIAQRRRTTRGVARGVLPWGVLAALSRRSYAEIVTGRFPYLVPARAVDPHDIRACTEAVRAAVDRDVVIGLESVATVLTLPLDVREAAMAMFRRLLTTYEVLRDARRGHEDLIRPVKGFMHHDPYTGMTRLEKATADDATQAARSAAELLAAIERLTHYPRPAVRAAESFDRPEFGAWMSIIDLAHTRDIPLWVDDPVLRAIARHSGIPAFSTPALIDHLAERQTVTISRRETAMRCMISGRVGDLPLDERRLLELAEDERWKPGSVAAVIARPAAWADEQRATALYRRLLSEAKRNGIAAVGQWLYSAVAGAATAANTPAAASRTASILLAQTIHDLDARGESVPQLVAAARRALYDCDDVDREAAPDPLPLCSRLLTTSANERALPHMVTRDALTRFAALPDHDRLAVTQALLG